jgi:hypothetical protein
MRTFALLLLAANASAGTFTTTKPVTLDRLNSELEAAGCVLSGDRSYTMNGKTFINTVTDCDVAAVVAAHVVFDAKAARQAMLDELAAIEVKLDAGTETAAERRRFMKLLLKLNGWARRP